MTLSVNTKSKYDILVCDGAFSALPTLLTRIFAPCRAVIVSDDIVWGLYGDIVKEQLRRAGFEPLCFTFPYGEKSKNLETLTLLLFFLTEKKLNKGDFLVALGGGVVSDLCGFAASCFLRGIPYITLPTTLLAAVDASIGGKTAVNHAGQKNNVGAFYPPRLVVCDTITLKTLQQCELQNGITEAVKTAALKDELLFSRLCHPIIHEDYEEIIISCLKIKKSLVEEDEFDLNARRLLNFGHTLGHAIEAHSDYRVSHGNAVAAGMVAITKIAQCHNLTKDETATRLETALGAHMISSVLPYPLTELVPYIVNDKKTFLDTVTLALIKDIGCGVLYDIKICELSNFFEVGL